MFVVQKWRTQIYKSNIENKTNFIESKTISFTILYENYWRFEIAVFKNWIIWSLDSEPLEGVPDAGKIPEHFGELCSYPLQKISERLVNDIPIIALPSSKTSLPHWFSTMSVVTLNILWIPLKWNIYMRIMIMLTYLWYIKLHLIAAFYLGSKYILYL